MNTDKQPSDNYQVLTRARKRKGWCAAVMAKKLSLTETAIWHIEQGNPAHFPKGPYFVGNLKRYCECVEVDSNPLLEIYYAEKLTDVVGDYQEPQMHKSKLTSEYQHKKHKTFYGLACAAMVCVLVSAITSQTIIMGGDVTGKPNKSLNKGDERL